MVEMFSETKLGYLCRIRKKMMRRKHSYCAIDEPRCNASPIILANFAPRKQTLLIIALTMQATPATKQRIQYIDLAKGFCILLVVASHILAFYRTQLPYDSVLKCFRMPLYFFLSGVFFKQYENFGGFVKRKINKLLIPFLFFYIPTITRASAPPNRIAGCRITAALLPINRT